MDKDRSMDLVSLLVEPVSELPQWCERPLPVDCFSSQVDTDQVLLTVCTDLVNRLKSKLQAGMANQDLAVLSLYV